MAHNLYTFRTSFSRDQCDNDIIKSQILDQLNDYIDDYCNADNWTSPVFIVLKNGTIIPTFNTGLKNWENSSIYRKINEIVIEKRWQYIVDWTTQSLLTHFINKCEKIDESLSKPLLKTINKTSKTTINKIREHVPKVLSAAYRVSPAFPNYSYSRYSLAKLYEQFVRAQCNQSVFCPQPPSPYDNYPGIDISDINFYVKKHMKEALLVVDIHT